MESIVDDVARLGESGVGALVKVFGRPRIVDEHVRPRAALFIADLRTDDTLDVFAGLAALADDSVNALTLGGQNSDDGTVVAVVLQLEKQGRIVDDENARAVSRA